MYFITLFSVLTYYFSNIILKQIIFQQYNSLYRLYFSNIIHYTSYISSYDSLQRLYVEFRIESLYIFCFDYQIRLLYIINSIKIRIHF